MFVFVFCINWLFAFTPMETAYLQWVDSSPKVEHPEENYRYYAELHQEIAQQVRLYPGRIEPLTIGRTVENRSIWAFKIAAPSQNPEFSVLIFAGLHALEWVGVEAAVDSLIHLTQYPPSKTEVIVVPIINIDRRLVVEEDLIKGDRKYRRVNSNGEDLNRDFEIHREATAIWRHLYPERYSVSKSELSQPESKSLDRLGQEYLFDACVSLHSFGGYIYYPWAGRYYPTEDHDQFHQIATIMKAAQKDRHPYHAKQLSHWMFLFRAQGTELDHFYGKYGTLSFLIETTRSGIVWWDHSTWKDPFRMYNPIDPSLDRKRTTASILALVNYYDNQ